MSLLSTLISFIYRISTRTHAMGSTK